MEGVAIAHGDIASQVKLAPAGERAAEANSEINFAVSNVLTSGMPKSGVVVRIDKVRRGRAASRGDAILEHLDGLYRFAMRLTRDRQLAQELVQESAVRALERRETIIDDLRAWLFQTLYHTFVSDYRRILREETFSEDSPEIDTPRGADLRLAPKVPDFIAAEDVRRSIESLPQELRTVVWLSDAEEFRLREIAEILGWPQGTVASRLWRARQELRRLLAAYGPRSEEQS